MNNLRNQFLIFFVIFCFAALNPGCNCDGKKGDTGKKTEDAKSKVDYFMDTQGPSVMPHGKIEMDTVQETSDGKIQYLTDDGKKWRVTMTKQADGAYRYGTPVEITPDEAK